LIAPTSSAATQNAASWSPICAGRAPGTARSVAIIFARSVKTYTRGAPAIKRKFGDSLRSKTDTAQVNETLAKVLCHNLVVLIHEMYELGLDPVFWAESA